MAPRPIISQRCGNCRRRKKVVSIGFVICCVKDLTEANCLQVSATIIIRGPLYQSKHCLRTGTADLANTNLIPNSELWSERTDRCTC